MRIKRADVTFLSLCQRGKNKLKALYKSDDTVEFQAHVIKSADFDERGELYAVVYAPNMPDADGDFADAQVIQDMAHNYLRKGAKIDTLHDEKALTSDQVYVAESFVMQKADPRFADQVTYDGKPVDVTGGWGVVIKIDDPAIRKSYNADGWQGISLGGTAVLSDEPLTKAQQVALALAAKKSPSETPMKPEDITKAIQDAIKPLADDLAALKKAAPAPAAPVAPVVKAEDEKPDMTDPKVVDAHLAKLAKAALLKDVDFDDLASVQKYRESLKALEKGGKTPAASNQGETVKPAADDELRFGNLTKADDVGSKSEAAAILAIINGKKEA